MKTILRYLLLIMLLVPTTVMAQADEACSDSIVTVKEMRQIRRAERSECEPKPRLMVQDYAVRTNLLRWATFTPEIGLVWHFDPKWDLQLNLAWSSASWHLLERRYGLWSVSPEVRRYLGKNERWYVGGQLEVSKRHYKFTDRGREGWIFGGGMVGGYQWRISRHTSVDLHIGAGYNGGNLKNYDLDVYFEGQHPVRTYRDTEYYQYYGINHVGISLVWDL